MRTSFWLGLAMLASLTTYSHAQDAVAGATVFKKCAACHTIGENAFNKVGPELNGLIGRAAASVAGFNYSPAMKASGLTWDEATLMTFLASPRGTVPGTKMTFAGLKSETDLANVIAYLKEFAADGTTVSP